MSVGGFDSFASCVIPRGRGARGAIERNERSSFDTKQIAIAGFGARSLACVLRFPDRQQPRPVRKAAP